MKIKKISNDEVVVFLSMGDLELFDLSPDSFEPKSAELHRFLFLLMETVREETGFDPFEGQVVVEAARTREGVHLSISKVGGFRRRKKKISRDDFNRAAAVRVRGDRSGHRQRRDIRDMDMSSGDLYRSLFDDDVHSLLAKKSNTNKKERSYVFVFSTYSDLEAALCIADEEHISAGELYRSGKRYAVIMKMTSMDGCYNILDFTESYCRSDLVARRVREAWEPVAAGEKLSEMARALRDMI